MSLIEKQVAASTKENAINKRLIDNAYKAVFDSKKFKETSRKSPKVIYEKTSLLDKIITSNLNDSIINKRLEQISYSAINGQRQGEETYKPEGVQMLGQMGREKPLTAITKEMIKEYQDEEKAKPFMIEGEARKYMGATYEPQFPVPFEELKSTDDIDTTIERYRQRKTDISNEISTIDNDIKETTDKIATIKNEINTKGSNFGNLYSIRKETGKLEQLRKERKELENETEQYNYYLQLLDNNKKEIIKSNSLLNLKNREEVIKYEQALQSANKNRLNLQQQPYESEYEYYKRLKEVEKEKFDPVLYKQYAANEETKKLKTNLNDLYSDVSFKEDIMKNINDENKFLINKLFDKVSKLYLDEYGYNNTKLSPKMVSNNLINILNSVRGQAASQLQAIMKRRPQREIYSDTIELARDRQDLEARQEARQTAATQLQARMKRRPQREIYSDTIELARDRQGLEARQAAQAAARQEEVATNIQKLFKGNKGRINAQLLRTARDDERLQQEREYLDNQDRGVLEEQNAKNIQKIIRGYLGKKKSEKERLKFNQLTRAQAISQAIAQGKAQGRDEEQTQRIAQALTLSKRLKEEDKQKATKKAIEKRRLKEEQDIKRLEEEQQYLNNQDKKILIEQATKKIQKIFKGNKGREAAKILLEQKNANIAAKERQTLKEQAKINNYARTIQRAISNFTSEKISNKEKERKKELANELLRVYTPQSTISQLRTSPAKTNENLPAHIVAQKLANEIYEKEKLNALQRLEQYEQPTRTKKDIFVSPPTSPGSFALSIADTIAEQERAKLRKPRSDLGGERAPYMTKKKAEKELKKQIDELYTPKEAKELKQLLKQGKLKTEELKQTRAQTRSEALDLALKRPGMKTLQDIGRELQNIEEDDEPMAKTSAPKKGKGIKKPSKRRNKVSQEEKKKDRLRLVVAQIKAGNTNPQLIVEVNKLYKDLYNIDNANMMLK